MSYIVTAYVVMAYIVMAYIVMAYTVMACIVMARGGQSAAMVAVGSAACGMQLYFWRLSGHADGERRGLDRIGG